MEDLEDRMDQWDMDHHHTDQWDMDIHHRMGIWDMDRHHIMDQWDMDHHHRMDQWDMDLMDIITGLIMIFYAAKYTK